MIAEILSVGTELLLGDIIDTNAAYLARMLSRLGIASYYRTTVGDNPVRMAAALTLALSRSDVIITIGGLGPTMDDLTKEMVAESLGAALIEDAHHASWLRERYRMRGLMMPPESVLRQAQIPSQGRGIANPNGTALGAIFEINDKVAICLPGPPNELIPMAEQTVEPYLRDATSGEPLAIESRTLRIVGMGETLVEENVRDLMLADNPTVAPYAKPAEVHLRVTARAESDSAASALIAPVAQQIRERLGDAVYGTDTQTLEEIVVRMLESHGMTLAVAESCSGGLIAKRLTDVPDASHVFSLSLVTYSNEAKSRYLNIPAALIESVGAVSSEVARAMAEGARSAAIADLGVSVTGIAGPGGGTPAKPVGTVHVGLAWEGGSVSEHYEFLGSRTDIAYRASQAALAMVRSHLLRHGNK